MPRNKEKIERNKIREKYAREYAGKLASKDADIRALCQRNDELRRQVERLTEKSKLDDITIQRLDELVKTLQRWTELSDSELDALRDDLMKRHELMESAGKLDESLKSISRAFGCMPSSYGLTSMLQGLFGGGLAESLFNTR